MPDPDPSAPDLVEFSPPAAGLRGRLASLGGKRRPLVAVAAVAVIGLVVALAVTRPSGGRAGDASAARADPGLAKLIAQVTNVPVRTSEAAGDGGGQVTAKPVPVTGPPLAANGAPEVFYAGTEYCPYCAAQSWAMIVALSRFGTFRGLRTIVSGDYPPCPYLAAWTFYRSAYASRYVTFVPVETRSNVLISPTADPRSGESYTGLQKMTAAQQAVFSRYDRARAFPFADFGNRYVLVGAGFPPMFLEQLTWREVAASLRNPYSMTGQAILGAANYVTAAICQLTAGRPASVCTPAVRSLVAPAN
ncbi:MAG: DUF929 family protein [Streptosporangiaceae bacterium]|nr:DUF929 family protein [Streptosporangiaceae bacterium]